MKKKPLRAIGILLLGLSACRDPTRVELRSEFVRGCYAESDRKSGDARLRRIYYDYCDCAADQVVNRFSAEELKALNKLQQVGKAAAALEQMKPVILPCLDALAVRLDSFEALNIPQ